MILADQIREYVFQKILDAKENGQNSLVISAKEIHEALGLENRYPAVCGALDTQQFLNYKEIKALDRIGPKQGSTALWKIIMR